MKQQQIIVGIENIDRGLWLLKLNKTSSIVFFQQLGIVLANFPSRILYEFIIEILHDTNKDIERTGLEEQTKYILYSYLEKFDINLEISLKGRLDSKLTKYFQEFILFLFELQPEFLIRSNHSKKRFIKSHYLYIIECILNLILTKDIYLKANYGNQILRFYSCEFSTRNDNKLFLTQNYSELKLKTIKKYLTKLLTIE